MTSSATAKMDDEEKATSCGLFDWRPHWIQRFASPRCYLAIYSTIGIIQGMVFSYLTVVLSNMEKTFGLSSKEIAWVYSGNEISQICFVFFLPFVGRVKKRPLWLGLSIMLAACGTLLIALPNFAFKRDYVYHDGGADPVAEKDADLCGPKEVNCTSKKDWGSMAVIFLGIFLMGIGVSLFYSFGLPYVDDNSEKENSPFRLSIVMSCRIVGPAFGFIMGSSFLKLYVVPSVDPGFDEDDPRWIGAWWVGFIVVGILLLFLGPWLTLFPSRLPVANTDAHKVHEMRKGEKAPETLGEWVSEVKDVAKRLLGNTLWVMNITSTIFFLFGFVGFSTFIPKYFEYHFRQRASTTGALGGLSKAIPSVIGLLTSGYLIGKYKFRAKTLAAFCVVGALVAVLGFVLLIFMACPRLEIYGMDDRTAISTRVRAGCSSGEDCQCADVDYHPICSLDGVSNFFSPCHAGCHSSNRSAPNGDGKRGVKFYQDCSCVEEHSRKTEYPEAKKWWIKGGGEDADGGRHPVASGTKVITTAVENYCPSNCTGKFYGLLAILAVAALVGSATRVPNLLINLRIIEKKDKSSAITLTVCLFSLFAFFPAPIVYGALIDGACVLWDNKCGVSQNCLVYDSDRFRKVAGGTTVALLIVSAFFDFLVWYIIPKDLAIYDDHSSGVSSGSDAASHKHSRDSGVEILDGHGHINDVELEHYPNGELDL